MRLRSLCNYCKAKLNYDESENDNNNIIYNNKTITSKFFEYKTKLIGSTSNKNDNILEKLLFH